MSANTKIEWADSTFNSWSGCTKISPACDHCYAEALSKRAPKTIGQWGAGAPRRRTSPAYWKQPLQWNAKPFRQCKECGWRGDDKARGHMPFDTESDTAPLKGCPSCGSYDFADARRRVFCASLADVFDNEANPRWRADLFELIAATPNLDWLLLTKRIGNVAKMAEEACETIKARNFVGNEYMRGRGFMAHVKWPLPNIWLGATICNQAEADRDIHKLLSTPAAKRFLSIEPMLASVAIAWALSRNRAEIAAGFLARGHFSPGLETLRPLDWVICGGESGPHARPMHPDWPRSLRDQCAAAGVPFLFKQWGEFLPAGANSADPAVADVPESRLFWSDGAKWDRFDGQRGGVDLVARVGKHAAGRLLDGVEHNGVPA